MESHTRSQLLPPGAGGAAPRCRAYLLRDVFDEMSLNGVRPTRPVWLTALHIAMRARKLGDALHFWEEMRRHGVEPDVRALRRAALRCAMLPYACAVLCCA